CAERASQCARQIDIGEPNGRVGQRRSIRRCAPPGPGGDRGRPLRARQGTGDTSPGTRPRSATKSTFTFGGTRTRKAGAELGRRLVTVRHLKSGVSLIAMVAVLAACASQPRHPRVERAQAEVKHAKANPAVNQYAASSLAQAEDALSRAEASAGS